MEYLYKLYEMKYFGVILLGTIIFLSFLFLIVLFAGKKDKNKRLEETKKIELAAINSKDYKEVDDNTKEIKVPEIEQPKIENLEKEVEEVSNNNVTSTIPEEILSTLNVTEDDSNSNSSLETDKVKKEVSIDLASFFNEEESNNTEVKESPSSVPFELPKVAEMPKLKEEKKENNENIFGEVNQDNNIFSNIENETYNIK